MKTKKLIAATLAAALAFSTFAGASVSSEAAKKPALSKTKLSLEVGKNKTLKVKNLPKKATVTWKTGDKAVAKVSKKGKVTAVAAGKTTIKAVVKKSKKTVATLKCKITVTEAETTTPVVETKKTDVHNTEYGPIQGIVQDDVESFYGIPYGKNPVGELRWATPVAPDKWTETRDCSEKEEIAIQQAMDYTTMTSSIKGTTDCLNLDVFAPVGAENKPVLVYVHGGNNQTGGSYDELKSAYDTANRLDCVVVSINYRTSFLGFNALPAITRSGKQTGNFGLLDMAEALKWVQRNIGEFGGNKDNVTVSGFSAGGRDVMAMLLSSNFKGLFTKAIAFSGGMTVCDLDKAAKKDAEMFAPLAIADGKAKTTDEAIKYLMQDNDEVRAYLASLTPERLTEISPNAKIRMSAFPHLFGDDITLPKAGFTGTFAVDVPVIMLTGTTEFSMFASDDYSSCGDQADAAKDFAIKYGSDFYRIFNTQLSAEKMSGKYRSNIYLVQVNYGDLSSANAISSPYMGKLGSFHGIFVPMLSKENGYASFTDFNAAGYTDMATAFAGYLKNFMATGNPNGTDTAVKWEAWTTADKKTLILDADETTGKAVIKSENVYKTNAQIIEEIEKDNTLKAENKTYVISKILNGRWFSDDLDTHFKTASGWNE